MPVIVGAPRSGTTLLRLMLYAHPGLAVPPETGFLALCGRGLESSETSPERFVDTTSDFPPDAPTWPDFGIDKGSLSGCWIGMDVSIPPQAAEAFIEPMPTDSTNCAMA